MGRRNSLVMISTTCGRIFSKTRWTTASTKAGSGVPGSAEFAGAGSAFAAVAAGGCATEAGAGWVIAAGTAGAGATGGVAGVDFSAKGSTGLGWRLAVKSAQSCLGIERAVSSALCFDGFETGGAEFEGADSAFVAATKGCCSTGIGDALAFSATGSVDLA